MASVCAPEVPHWQVLLGMVLVILSYMFAVFSEKFSRAQKSLKKRALSLISNPLVVLSLYLVSAGEAEPCIYMKIEAVLSSIGILALVSFATYKNWDSPMLTLKLYRTIHIVFCVAGLVLITYSLASGKSLILETHMTLIVVYLIVSSVV
jgi:hypothetical protein